MNKFYFIFAAVMAASTISSAALLPDMSLELQGVDVRNKDQKYELSLSKENILIQERTFTLRKTVGDKKQLVAQGSAVLSGSDAKNSTEAIWLGENTQIKIGNLTNSHAPKQVVVLKLTNVNRTFAFEIKH